MRKALLVRLGVGCLVTVAVLLAILAVWSSSRQCPNPTLAEKLYNDTLQRVRDRNQVAADRSRNLWLTLDSDRSFDPLLAEQRPLLLAWSRVDPAGGDIAEALAKKDPQLLSNIKEYEGQKDRLVAVLALPACLDRLEVDAPDAGGKALASPGFSFTLIVNMLAYSDVLRLRHRPEEALEHLLLTLETLDKAGQQGGVEYTTRVCHYGVLTLGCLIELLGQERFSASALVKMRQRLDRLHFSPDVSLERSDENYARNILALRRMGSSAFGGRLVGGLLEATVNGREVDLYQSYYLRLRPHEQSLDNFDVRKITIPSQTLFIQQRVSSGPASAKDLYRALLRALQGLRLMARLKELEALKNLPQSLQDMSLPERSPLPWSQFHYLPGVRFSLTSDPEPVLESFTEPQEQQVAMSFHPRSNLPPRPLAVPAPSKPARRR